MLASLLRKLKLGRPAFRVIQAFLPRRRDDMTVAEAMERLAAVCPDGHGKSIKEAGEDNSVPTKAELDIIIPAYNVEKYLRACLDSVLGQETGHSFRVIVIDDGSTDGTPEILREYEGDSRVLIRRQENRGLSGARNAGIVLSAAPWLTFLDSDDMLSPGAIDALMACACADSTEMVVVAYETMDVEGRSLKRQHCKEGRIEELEDCAGFAWGRALRRELFDGLRFPEGYWYEDSLVAVILCPLIRQRRGEIYGVDAAAVRYRVNPQGISRQGKSRPKCIDSLWVHMQLDRDRQTLGLPKTQDYYEYMLWALLLTGRRTENQPEDIRRAVFTVFADFMAREFPDFKSGDGFMRYLEDAVRWGDYGRYKLFCQLA